MKTVAIIYGGKSSEHEVSLVSATSVVRHIDRNKFNVELIGITKDGRWFSQPESELKRVISDEKATLTIGMMQQLSFTAKSGKHMVNLSYMMKD